MTADDIVTAIHTHGAQAVHTAAVARLEGKRLPLERLGLFAITLSDANAVLTAAYNAMSGVEQDVEHVNALLTLARHV